MTLFSRFRLATLCCLSAAMVSSSAFADGWNGFMNVFDNAGVAPVGSQGAYQFSSPWGVPDVKTTVVTANPGTTVGDALVLEPNYNCYANALGGNDGDRAYWTNSTNGGVTAGPYGNKWMDANTYAELNGIGLPSFTFKGSVTANTLNTSRYLAEAFIKVLDPSNGYATVLNNRVTLPTTGTFETSANLSGFQGKLLQWGFAMSGLNGNPADAANNGSVSVSVVVPEPSTIAGLASAGIFAMVFGLRRRRSGK